MIKEIDILAKNILTIIEKEYGYSKHHICTPYLEIQDDFEIDSKGEYCYLQNEITIYRNNIRDTEELTRTLIHEYQHYLQSPTWMTRYYIRGHNYLTHPYEIQANREESNWQNIWKQVL